MASSNKGNPVYVKLKTRPQVVVNQSGLTSRRLEDLSNIDATNRQDGSVLVYDDTSDKWLATSILEKQTVNGGNF